MRLQRFLEWIRFLVLVCSWVVLVLSLFQSGMILLVCRFLVVQDRRNFLMLEFLSGSNWVLILEVQGVSV